MRVNLLLHVCKNSLKMHFNSARTMKKLMFTVVCSSQMVQTSKAQSIPFGARGVLVSCITGKEIPAAREAIAVFYEAYEVLCPASVDAKQAKPSDGDISALLANEVADLKDLSKQPFVFRKLGIPSLTFIEIRYAGSPSPTELVAHICRSAQTEKQNKTRLCSRFYPIEHVCPAKLDDIQELAKDLAATHFPEQATPVSVRSLFLLFLRNFPC